MPNVILRRAALVLSAFALTLPATVLAQEFTGKPIRIVIGFAAGGGHDLVARLLAPRVGAATKLQVIVEPSPGANGMIAADHVAKAAPDGHTVILTGVSTFVLNQLVYSKVPYDTTKDLAPVSVVAGVPQIFVAHPSIPAKSLQELTAPARRQPGKLTAASPGIGGLSHLTLEIYKNVAKLDIEHVAYKGTGAAMTDILSGYVPILVADVPALLPHVKSGKLRALAVTSEARSTLLPDVPNAREQGYPSLQAMNWYGVMAPAGTPPALLDRLHAAFAAAVNTPETRERLSAAAVEPMSSESPIAFGQFVREEFARWGQVVRATGIQLQQ
jgi:tripartite-type tricarboxylate transporter receptor subunit TctC